MADSKRSKKDSSGKQQKPNIFSRIGRWVRSLFSELGKVSWPTAGKVIKKTGIVLAVVCIFLVITLLFDLGLGALYKQATKDLADGTTSLTYVLSRFGGLW